MEDLYTWPFKVTQNMVHKNRDKITKDPDKVPTPDSAKAEGSSIVDEPGEG